MPSDILIFVSPDKAEDPRYAEAQKEHGRLVAHPKFGPNDIQVATRGGTSNIWDLSVVKDRL